jgi:predicted transglutaminase-like cysteine proteinase
VQQLQETRWRSKELRMALATQITSRGKRVLPVRIDDRKIPGFLLEKVYANLKDHATYDQVVDKLADDIRHLSSGA